MNYIETQKEMDKKILLLLGVWLAGLAVYYFVTEQYFNEQYALLDEGREKLEQMKSSASIHLYTPNGRVSSTRELEEK